MLSTVLNLLKKPAARSDELRQALSEISSAEAKANVDRLEAERRRLLLEGSDKELRTVEENLASARRDLDRANAATEELQRRIAETEAKEKADAFAAERKAIEDEAEAAAVALQLEYPLLAQQLVTLLDRVKRANAAASVFNANIMTKRASDPAARSLMVASVESRVFAGFQEGLSASITGQTLIVGVQGFAPGWNDANVQMFSSPLKVA